MHRHEKFDHGDDLSTRLTTLVEKLEMLMTTISRNQGLNMGPIEGIILEQIHLSTHVHN